MNRIAEFQKVSFSQFFADYTAEFPDSSEALIRELYSAVPLPARATSGSAGYDFKAPDSFTLEPGCGIKIPTAIRVRIDDGWLLAVFPRSSLGFKFRMTLDNTVGIIDADYYGAANEGHIMIKLTNNSDRTMTVERGAAFAQGIFLPFGITYDDSADGTRTGGFGSTDKNK